MRVGVLVRVAAATAAVLAVAPVARADAGATETTYTIENLDAYPDQVFVAWPRTCGSTGDPLGAVSLQLNPDWVSRLHEMDYEVVEKGKRHQVSSYCLATMRIHALPAAAFPRATRVATADDASLGKKPGETITILPALDAIDLQQRIPFFASDARQASLPFRFDGPAGAHHDLVIVGSDGGLTLAPAKALPSAADGGADAGLAVTAAPTPPTQDIGTRWVYAAAIAGLLAGGVIAYYRKKRAAS
jgi:hypothetical protein